MPSLIRALTLTTFFAVTIITLSPANAATDVYYDVNDLTQMMPPPQYVARPIILDLIDNNPILIIGIILLVLYLIIRNYRRLGGGAQIFKKIIALIALIAPILTIFSSAYFTFYPGWLLNASLLSFPLVGIYLIQAAGIKLRGFIKTIISVTYAEILLLLLSRWSSWGTISKYISELLIFWFIFLLLFLIIMIIRRKKILGLSTIGRMQWLLFIAGLLVIITLNSFFVPWGRYDSFGIPWPDLPAFLDSGSYILQMAVIIIGSLIFLFSKKKKY